MASSKSLREIPNCGYSTDQKRLEAYFYVAGYWRGHVPAAGAEARIRLTVGAALQILSNAEVGLAPDRLLTKRIKALKDIIILGRSFVRKEPPPPDRQVKKFRR